MTEQEQLIADFEHEVNKAHGEGWDFVDLSIEDAEEILALLKEQEAVEPHLRCPTIYMNSTGKIELMCGNCGISIPLGKPNYCPWCGRAVKWNAHAD